MTRRTLKIIAASALLASIGALSACEDKPATTAGQKVDKAVEKAGEKTGDAMKKGADAMNKGADAVKDATKKN